MPQDFRLFQNYPNPFNSNTILSYQLDKPANINIDIYDIKGSLVRHLSNQRQGNGYYQITWDGMNAKKKPVPSGLYFARFQINNRIKSIRLQLIK